MKRKQSYEFDDCLSGDDQGDETSYDMMLMMIMILMVLTML